METNMRPVRIPYLFSDKYSQHCLLYFMLLWYGLPIGVVFLHPSDRLLLAFIGFWLLIYFALCFFSLRFDLILFPEGIQVRLLGKVIRQIPITEVKVLCGLGEEGWQNLCISMWDMEELAAGREETLCKGYFSRQELPFRKKSPGWQERFAKEFMLNPKRLIWHSPVLLLPMDPVIAVYLRRLYPQLPYVQLCSNRPVPLFMAPRDRIPHYTERFRIDEKGVHILGDFSKEERRLFPAERIQTIFRVDRFSQASKVEPAYASYLVVSELSLEELALRGKQKRWNKWKKQLIAQLSESEEMYAAEFHFSGVFTWNWRKSTECHFWNTPETEAKLRQYFPNARWVDYSKQWL